MSNQGLPVHNGRIHIPQLPYGASGNVHTHDNYDFHKDINIYGNAHFLTDLIVDGNLTITGNFIQNSFSNTVTEDLVLVLGNNNTNNNYYSGLQIGYNSGNGFFGYNPNTSIFELYSDIDGNTINSSSFTGTTIKGILNSDLIGNVTGEITGNVTGNLHGDVHGDVTGDLYGNVYGNFTGTIIGDTNVYGNITIHSYMSLSDVYLGNNIYGNNINNLVTINDNLTVNNDLIIYGNSSFLNDMDLNDNKIINVNKINDRYLINETIETTVKTITFTVDYSSFTDDFVDYHLHITCLEDNGGTYETTTYFYETKGYYQSDGTYTEDDNDRSGSHISISSKTWNGSSYIIEINHGPNVTMYKWNISGEITTKQTINSFSITV